MTPKGIKWTDEQKARQSQICREAMARLSAEKKRLTALRGWATRRNRQEQSQAKELA